jgi:hypothetical protein
MLAGLAGARLACHSDLVMVGSTVNKHAQVLAGTNGWL